MALYNFHSGCLDCIQQEYNGSDFCFNCCYFEADWSKRNLQNKCKTFRSEELRRNRITTERDRIKLLRQQPPSPSNAIKTSDRVQQLLKLPISQAPILAIQLTRFLSKKYGAGGEIYAAAYEAYAIVCEQTEGGICDEECRHFLTAIKPDCTTTITDQHLADKIIYLTAEQESFWHAKVMALVARHNLVYLGNPGGGQFLNDRKKIDIQVCDWHEKEVYDGLIAGLRKLNLEPS